MSTGTTDVQLNAAQKKAVTHGEGPLLIVAGAGTGKTTVVTQRILWLLTPTSSPSRRFGRDRLQRGSERGFGVKPENILALTFTEKAAEEMVTRIDQALPYGYTQLSVSTFHSFCQRVLQEHGLDIGIPNDFRLVNDIDAWLLVRRNLDRFNLDYYRPLGNPTKFIHALLKHFSRCKDEAVGPEEYLEYAKGLRLDRDLDGPHPNPLLIGEGIERPPLLGGEGGGEVLRIHELANAYHTYQQILLENSALDFGDLLTYTLRLLRERPAILARYQQQFQHILVDEFQDTNWTQYELVKLLAAPENNITVVSDDDQAIYRWRGASYNNVVVFARDYPNATKVSLVENYRSVQNILDCAYAFIQHNNPNRLEAQLKEGKEKLGVVTKKLVAQRPGTAPIEHLHGATEFEEARLVVERILDLRSKNKKSEILNLKSEIPNWSDFAILVRANAMAEPFIRAFEREGIPYQFLASRGLYAKPIVLDCVAYLRLLDDYHESPALYRILTSPVVALAPEDLVRLTHHAGKKNESLYETLRIAATLGLSKESVARCSQLLQWISRHTALARTKTVSEVLYAFLEDSGYLKELTKQVQHTSTAALSDIERVRYLEQFFRKIAAFEAAEREPTVRHFLSAFDYAIDAGEEGGIATDIASGPDTVKIMTVHAAKGLEFRYVFIVQCVELRFPSVDRRDPIMLPDALVKEIIPEGDAHLEEERRLFYVAMTRSRDGLFFTSAEDYGGQRKKRPSRFLFEVGMIEKSKVKSPKHALSKVEGSKVADIQLPHYPTTQLPITNYQLPLPSQFSYTQLKAFETCPLQYKFAHILKIPVRGRFTFSFGKSMHATLQKFFQRMMEGQSKKQQDLFGPQISNTQFPIPNKMSNVKCQMSNVPSLDELLKIYDASWIGDWYESKKHAEEYYEKGEKILKELYTLHEGKWPDILALEQPFTMKVGSYTIKGVIDRIDRVDGGVRIVDYKTGNVPKNERDLDREQLYLYQIAVGETMREKPGVLQYYYLDAQKQFEFIGTEEEIAAAKERVRMTLDAITASDFTATPSPQKCRNCDFKEICEYRKL